MSDRITAENFAADGDTAFADGHPGEPCSGPVVEGEVVVEEDLPVEIDGRSMATGDNAFIHFPNHGHDIEEDEDDEEVCVNFQEHDIEPDAPESGIEVGGETVILRGEVVGQDPVTGGDVWIEEP